MSYAKSISGTNVFLPVIVPTVKAWRDRAIANGGSVPLSSILIAQNFINAITGSSYYGKIVYLLPMIGGNLSASLVPLIDKLGVGPATNSGFVNTDFNESTGLKGNGTSKILDSGIRPSQLGVSNNGGIGWWDNDIDFGGTSVEPMGCYKNGSIPDNRFVLDVRSTPYRAFRWGAAANWAYDTVTAGHANYYGQRSGSALREIFVDGVSKATNTTNDAADGASDNTIRICGSNEGPYGLVYWKGRCAVTYMTDGTLTSGEVAQFHGALNTYLFLASGKAPVSFGPISSADYGDGFQQWGTWAIYSHPSDTSYVCPGTGNKRLYSLQFWAKSNGGTPGTGRIAIYDTSFNLIGQGVSTFTVSSTTPQWIGHVGYNSLKPIGGNAGDPVYLTGGTQYIVAFSTSNTDLRIGYKSVGTSVSSSWYKINDWTSGFPNSFTAGTQFTERLPVKVEINS